MKTLNKIYVGLFLALISLNEVFAKTPWSSHPGQGGGQGSGGGQGGGYGIGGGQVSAPEMDSSLAVLGLGLAISLAIYISVYRRS